MREGQTQAVARISTLNKWQSEWEVSVTGRWTYRLISDLRKWHERRHGVVNFHLTQFLTGHGSFQAYLKRFNRSETDLCMICGHDDAEHAVLDCDTWENWRRETCVYVGTELLRSSNIVGLMLTSDYNSASWARVIQSSQTKQVPDYLTRIL